MVESVGFDILLSAEFSYPNTFMRSGTCISSVFSASSSIRARKSLAQTKQSGSSQCLINFASFAIERKGFHSLRHTFATRALECGMDVKTLSEILGHKNATVTLNRYAHSLMEHKQDMMNKLGKIFN